MSERPQHEAYIAIHRGLRYAYCRCGWESEHELTAMTALKARDKHLDDNDTDFWEAHSGRTHGDVG